MGLRISKDDARRRISEAGDLGPRVALSGELLEPLLPTVAAGQLAGKIGVEHVKVIRKFFANLPDAVDYQAREEAEKDLGRLAAAFGPTDLRAAADRLAYMLDQDGPAPTDADRAFLPNAPHLACAIPTSSNPASTGNRQKRHRRRI